MAAVKTLAGEKLLIQIGDGGSPTEIFAHDCLINLDRAISFTADVSDQIVPDCDDPSAPAWKVRFVDGLETSISGSGVFHSTSHEAFFNWWKSGASKNIRFKLDTTGVLGGGYYAGAFKLASFSITGTRQNNSTAEISLSSDGEITWTDAA